MDENLIRKDRLRYSKNTVSSRLAILAIVFNVLFFVNIYQSDVGNYYYSWIIGLSIIYNLLFMLIVFLCSEGVKNYKISFSIAMIVVGALQFVRILVIPNQAVNALVKIGDAEVSVMGSGQFTMDVIYLVLSGILLIAAGIVGIMKTRTLESYNRYLETQK